MVNALQGVHRVYKNEISYKGIERQAHSIFNGNKNGRDYNQIYKNTEEGTIIEMAAAQVLNGTLHEGYDFDVESPFGNIEVKKKRANSRWLSYQLDYQHQGLNFTHFVENGIKKTDYLLVGDIIFEDEEYFDVQFELIIDSKTFMNYNKKSSGEGYFYSHYTAINDGNCVIIN